MRYHAVVPARFLARPNRFIARVEVDGAPAVAHVKNTGRCRELLVPGARIYLQDWGGDHPGRKTRYDVVAVEKGPLLINMDAQAPNRAFEEWARGGGFVPGLTLLRPETAWGSSRFDFYWEAGARRGFAEVKGVTLERDGHARFPDAPTQRGRKHLEELARLRGAGLEAAVCFVIQMEGMRRFSPNDRTDPAFGAALRRAAEVGVRVLAVGCHVTPQSMEIVREVPVCLEKDREDP